ncbi:MAG TPA: nuclear transport factor 2 family protein [Pseudomonadales bacterium]|nr:nuclear transport factor 2 family protein [Pseudomonadales bacterium]
MPPTTPILTAAQRRAIEQDCIALGHAWARALDFSDQDHFLELYKEDAVLEYDGTHAGLEAIAAWIGTRPRAVRTRHVMSNGWVDALDADHARGIAYVTLWQAPADGLAPEAAAIADGPVAVGHCQDRFVRGDDGWLFAARTLRWGIRRGDAGGRPQDTPQ